MVQIVSANLRVLNKVTKRCRMVKFCLTLVRQYGTKTDVPGLEFQNFPFCYILLYPTMWLKLSKCKHSLNVFSPFSSKLSREVMSQSCHQGSFNNYVVPNFTQFGPPSIRVDHLGHFTYSPPFVHVTKHELSTDHLPTSSRSHIY